jgi:hypothetical protein
MKELPKVVFLLVWESKTAGDTVTALLDEIAALHKNVERRKTWAEESLRKGDWLAAQGCTDYARGMRHATLLFEEVFFKVFDLWEQYEQQDP